MSSERDLDQPVGGNDDGDDQVPASEALPLTTLTRAASPDATHSLDRGPGDAEVSMTRSALVGGGEGVEPMRLFEAGELVDHFEVVELLGEGGMGAVYLAVDTKLGRRVALKVVQRSHLGSAKAVESFLYEARTTARFNHPHIVTVYAVGEHRGSPYVALEYLEGRTLQEIMREGRLTLEPALRVALAVAEALQEAHAHDVLHRDLKPANIVIVKDGRVRVLDFGLAKRIEGEAPPSTRLLGFGPREYTWAGAGTPAYMAPEQWRAEETTVATDVWAMGVLLFELCAGRRPFDEPSLVEQERVVCDDDEAPRLERFGAVPQELADLTAQCLLKKPSERPAVASVVAELRRMLGEPERLHFDGTRSTLRPPDSPVVSISGDAQPTGPTLLLDSDGGSQAEVGTAETMLDVGSDPGAATRREDAELATERVPGALDTRTSPSRPPGTATRTAAPSGSIRTALVAVAALVVGGVIVWLIGTVGQPEHAGSESAASPDPTVAEVVSADPDGTGASSTQEPVGPASTAEEEATAPVASSSADVEASAVAAAPVLAAPAKPRLPPFDEGAAQASLGRKAKMAEMACRFHDGARSFAVEVTFAPDGRAIRARHNMRFLDAGMTGTCVTGIVRGAFVPAFRGEAQTRTVGVTLPPKR